MKQRISPIQRRVLAEIAWDARCSVQAVAKRLRIKGHTARHAVAALEGRLEFQPICWTNPFLLGQVPYRVFLSLKSTSSDQVRDFCRFMIGMPEVSWFASIIGEYQFAIGIRGQSPEHLLEVFSKIDARFGSIIVSRNISMLMQLVFFLPWLAHAGPKKRRLLQYKATSERVRTDVLDGRLLSILQERPLASMSELGRCLNMAATTVSYRFDKLISSGAIIAFGYSYDEGGVGEDKYIVSVSTMGIGGVAFDALLNFGRDHPNVDWICRAIGQWDLEFAVCGQERDIVERFIHDLYAAGGDAIREHSIHKRSKNFKG